MKDKITELISTTTDDSRLGFFDYTPTRVVLIILILLITLIAFLYLVDDFDGPISRTLLIVSAILVAGLTLILLAPATQGMKALRADKLDATEQILSRITNEIDRQKQDDWVMIDMVYQTPGMVIFGPGYEARKPIIRIDGSETKSVLKLNDNGKQRLNQYGDGFIGWTQSIVDDNYPSMIITHADGAKTAKDATFNSEGDLVLSPSLTDPEK